MRRYNKIMLYFWLVISILIFVVVTFMALSEGFKKWSFHYIFAGLAFLAFISRRWMMRRMERHLEFMEQQKEAEEK